MCNISPGVVAYCRVGSVNLGAPSILSMLQEATSIAMTYVAQSCTP